MSKNKYQRQHAMHGATVCFKYQNKPIQKQSINMKGSIVFRGGPARFQTLHIQDNEAIDAVVVYGLE